MRSSRCGSWWRPRCVKPKGPAMVLGSRRGSISGNTPAVRHNEDHPRPQAVDRGRSVAVFRRGARLAGASRAGASWRWPWSRPSLPPSWPVAACMNAQQTVEPTKRKPRRFRSRLIALDSTVSAGRSSSLCRMAQGQDGPRVRHRRLDLRRLRTIPRSRAAARRAPRSNRATRAGSKPRTRAGTLRACAGSSTRRDRPRSLKRQRAQRSRARSRPIPVPGPVEPPVASGPGRRCP